MEVRQARYFIAVAEELHFGRAAHRLHMSQPPLSQAILALERELDVRLLHRTSRQVALTKAGEVLLKHCRQLVRESERTRAAVGHARDGLRGELVVGAVASAFTDLLAPMLRHYRKTRPEVRLRMVEVDTESGAEAVRNREVDLALVRRTAGGAGVRAVPLHRDTFVAALPLDHPHATGNDDLDLAGLAADPWVWIPREVAAGYHDEVVTACRRAGFSPDARHQANSIATQLAMVSGGLGVAIVPSLTVRARADVAVRRLRVPPGVVLSILVHEDADPLVEHFVATMVANSV
ncbi:LysR family transcriptional regulator [Actinoplanes sp. G11-F43]|uniref:LysR family transcriptional regulator n=1 Tax=Actinoplanes sp. G11-F43 TaxID=3424130 RepID=UPI003D332C30